MKDTHQEINTESKLTEMILDGRMKAKIDWEKESIMFDTHEEKVDVMTDRLQAQTLKIIKCM